MPKRPYPSWRRRHDAILFRILELPGAKHKAIARTTHYTRARYRASCARPTSPSAMRR